MIHTANVTDYRRFLNRLWRVLDCGAPSPGSLLSINMSQGKVIGLRLENVTWRVGDTKEKVKLHDEEHVLTSPGSDMLKVVSHTYHYQPDKEQPDENEQYAFRIHYDETELHANIDDKIVHGRQVKHRYAPEELTLDIREFNAVLFMIAVARYQQYPSEYPLFPEHGGNFNEELAPHRERLARQ